MKWMAGLFLLLMVAQPVVAQAPGGNGDTPEKKKDKPPARTVRILTLGDAPPFKQEVRDGVRYEMEPAPGTIPPREVIPGFGEKPKDGPKSGDEKEPPPAPIRLNLGRASAVAKIPDGAGPLELRRKDASAPENKPWVTVQRPEHGDLLVLIWRDPRGKNWDLVDALVLPDGPEAIGGGGVMLLNLVQTPIGTAFGSEKFQLPYGHPVIKKPSTQRELPVDVSALSADGKTFAKRYLSTVIPVADTECTRIIAYRADGESPRQPVKVLLLREPVKPEQPDSH